MIYDNLLNTQTKNIQKQRCFPIELYCVNMLPNTKYDFYCDGVNMNAFCKPYGKDLGDAIVSDSNGKVIVLFLMNLNYNDNYIINNYDDTVGYISKTKVLEFRDPSGVSSKTYMPVIMKPTK